MASELNSQEYDRGRRCIIEAYYGKHPSPKSESESTPFIDCYGFIHKNQMDAESCQVPSCRASDTNLNKLFKSDHESRKKLFKLVKSGIPHGVRPNAWKFILNVNNVRRTKRGVYKKILVQALRYSPHVLQIHLDVQRTFRNHVSFSEEYGVKQAELFNVLSAYSIYNAEVGYCQGMSEVAAILLMFMGEEDAFWAFERLFSLPLYNLHGIFTLNFPRLFALQEHHDFLLRRYSRSLYRHLLRCEVTSPLYTFRWFMQCFIGKIPFSATLRLYDMFFVEGDSVLTVMAFVVMRILRRDIKSTNFEGIMNLFNKFPLFMEEEADRVFRKCRKYRKIFDRDNVQSAPLTPQTIPHVPLILSDPLLYAKQCARFHPREATYEEIVADGVKNIQSKKVEADDSESCFSELSPGSIDSTATEISISESVSRRFFPSRASPGQSDGRPSFNKGDTIRKTNWKETRL